MLTLQPSALRGIVRRAGVVPLTETLPAQRIVALAPDGFDSTPITSLRPCVIVAHEERRQPVNSSATQRISIFLYRRTCFTSSIAWTKRSAFIVSASSVESMVTIANALPPLVSRARLYEAS